MATEYILNQVVTTTGGEFTTAGTQIQLTGFSIFNEDSDLNTEESLLCNVYFNPSSFAGSAYMDGVVQEIEVAVSAAIGTDVQLEWTEEGMQDEQTMSFEILLK